VVPPSQPQPVTPKGRRRRESLLDAGERLAERDGLSAFNIAALVAEAGVAKGTFYVYFADRDDFLDALHERFYAEVSEAVAGAVGGLAPGGEQLLAAIEAYLDVCLDKAAVKALVRETRALGNLTPPMAAREERFFALAEPSLEAIDLKPARISSRLIVAMTAEVALIEAEAGEKVQGARRLIRRLVRAADL
jgi:TetR/AcrR family transcriptional repressor of nem operon